MKTEDQNDISLMIMLGCLILALLSTACGHKVTVQGGTEHTAYAEVSGKVTQEVVIKIDVSACEDLQGTEKSQCIKDIVAAVGDLAELVKTVACKDQACLEGIDE